MATLVNDAPLFEGLTAEQVADPKRRLRDMTEGQVLVDCIGIGVRSMPLNRRFFKKVHIVHVAVRCKLPGGVVTTDALDDLGRVAETVQAFFEGVKRFDIADGAVSLEKAEPFIHVSRSQLYGDGLFLTPIEFTWIHHPG